MTVFVMNGRVNFENIDEIRSLFLLSHTFRCELPGFEIGTTIVMREVGVRSPNGRKLPKEKKNSLQREADAIQRKVTGSRSTRN
jgi:hypothetical protein